MLFRKKQEKLQSRLVEVVDSVDQKSWKRKLGLLVFVFFTAVASASAVWFFPEKNLFSLSLLAFLAAVSLSIFLIACLVFSANTVFLVTVIFAVLMFFPFLFQIYFAQWLILIGISVALLFFSRMRAVMVMKNSIKLNAGQVFGEMRKVVLLVLSLWLSLFCAAPFLKAKELPITAELVHAFLLPSEPFVRKAFNEFRYSMTIEELFYLSFERQMQGQKANIERILPGLDSLFLDKFQGLNKLSLQMLNQIRQEARKNFFSRLSEFAGREVKPTETVSEFVYFWVISQYAKLPVQFQTMSGALLFFVVFLLIYGTVTLMGFVFSAITWFLFKILLLIRLVRISSITVEKEILSV